MDIIQRPETTLYILVSVDGKISTGDTDALDTETDFPRIRGIKEGLNQYYQLQQEIDLHALESGRTMAKVGCNEKIVDVEKTAVSFIIIDNKPHLNLNGVDHFIKRSKTFYLVTTNRNHPAFERKDTDNLTIIHYEGKIDFADLFVKFKQLHGIDRITIESGGTLTATLLREKLIDHISLVVAPALVGGRDTSTLVDGESLHSEQELKHIKALKLKKCDILENSYLHLQYDVINDTVIEARQD